MVRFQEGLYPATVPVQLRGRGTASPAKHKPCRQTVAVSRILFSPEGEHGHVSMRSTRNLNRYHKGNE